MPSKARADINFGGAHFERSVCFRSFVFPGRASFDGATFSNIADFTEAAFFSDADFCVATFSGAASFRRVMFSGGTNFDRATFRSTAHFISASFCGPAGFEGAQFCDEGHFRSATFSDYASFNGAEFSAITTFVQAAFLGAANFSWAVFSDNAFFAETAFSLGASFNSTTFSGHAHFEVAMFADSADFTEAEFGRHTSFAGARFARLVPDFRDSELREATEWHDAEWPHASTDRARAQQQVYSYERLKAEMERLKKYADEQFFFAKELRARRALERRGSLKYLLNFAYETFAGYGQSVRRPMFWLVILFAAGAGLFALTPTRKGAPLAYDEAAALSITNLISFLPYKPDKGTVDGLSPLAKIIGDLQSFLGVILLFLLGLALRNQFRMK
jgi:uncharacterized protein YjbI with pentapeptide repeats